MATLALSDLLAQLHDGMYISPWKLLVMVILFTAWAAFAQWVDKDTLAVNTFRIFWNLLALGAGVVATLLMLFVPNFLLGLLFFLIVDGGLKIAYVLHRNGLVDAGDKVCTAAHFRRLQEQGFSGKKKKAGPEVKERVVIRDAAGERVAIPEDEAEREQYRLSQDLIFDVLWRRASRVELTPAGQAAKVSYSIDGVAAEREPMERPHADAILLFFKRAAGLDLEERRKPQSAKIGAAIGDVKVDVIVGTAGSTAGEKLTLRIIGEETAFKVADIGFTDEQLEKVRELTIVDKGLILLTAPPGAGLTTTIYSFVRSHDAYLQNIQTLEYKKELEINNITQHVYDPSEGKTITGDLQRIARSDPDTIVMPEVRERSTAVILSEAAADKQTVYVGLPATDVYDAFRRWMKLVGNNRLLAKSLLAVTSQRLVRTLCTQCRQPYKPDPRMLRKINMPADQVLYRPPEPELDKNGNPIICQNCQGSGYVGRTAVYDLVIVDDGLRKVIRSTGSVSEIQSYIMKKGGAGLQQQALHKVFQGKTAIQEVVRATRPPNAAGRKPKAVPKPRPRPSSGAAAQPAS